LTYFTHIEASSVAVTVTLSQFVTVTVTAVGLAPVLSLLHLSLVHTRTDHEGSQKYEGSLRLKAQICIHHGLRGAFFRFSNRIRVLMGTHISGMLREIGRNEFFQVLLVCAGPELLLHIRSATNSLLYLFRTVPLWLHCNNMHFLMQARLMMSPQATSSLR